MKTIGVLIPEFPGQTHNFFWREVSALKELGAEVKLFSTRKPASGIQSTSWGEAAMARTTYLSPVPFSVVWRLFRDLLISPSRVLRCTKIFASSVRALKQGESTVRLFVLMLIGVGLGRTCVDQGIRHLHVHSCADAANVALFAHAAFGIQYSMTLHNPLSIWGGNQSNKWRNARFGVAIAEWILNDAKSQLGGALPGSMHIAPMGVNVDHFKRSSPYQAMVGGVLKLFSCARLNPAKGFEVLIDSIDKLKKSGLQVHLTIAGEDDLGGAGYRKDLEQIITKRQLASFVRLLGAVSEERVRAELESAHVFVLASYEEPLGVAIMEAMAMEVPVIATDAGGVPSIITNEVNGLLVPPSDSVSLANAIASLASSPDLALALSGHGRERIKEAFSHRLSAKAIFDHV